MPKLMADMDHDAVQEYLHLIGLATQCVTPRDAAFILIFSAPDDMIHFTSNGVEADIPRILRELAAKIDKQFAERN